MSFLTSGFDSAFRAWPQSLVSPWQCSCAFRVPSRRLPSLPLRERSLECDINKWQFPCSSLWAILFTCVDYCKGLTRSTIRIRSLRGVEWNSASIAQARRFRPSLDKPGGSNDAWEVGGESMLCENRRTAVSRILSAQPRGNESLERIFVDSVPKPKSRRAWAAA